MITNLAREAFDDFCKRINIYHRLELEGVDMRTPQELRYMGCKVKLTEHKDQLQFGGE